MPVLSFCVRAFWKKSWSWVNMLWNVNCLHDNSPVSSFSFHPQGACWGGQTKCHACHGISLLIDLGYLKNTYSSMQISISSPLWLWSGLSPQCPCGWKSVCVCVRIKFSTVLWKPVDRPLASVQTVLMLCFAYSWQHCYVCLCVCCRVLGGDEERHHTVLYACNF